MLTSAQRAAIVDGIIDREGGQVNDVRDRGGLTKFGISQASYPDVDVANLTRADAAFIYQRDFISHYRLHELSNVRNAEIVADWFVNGANIKQLQKAVHVTQDGVIGQETLAALDTADAHELLKCRLLYYISLVPHPFLKGWVHRLFLLGL